MREKNNKNCLINFAFIIGVISFLCITIFIILDKLSPSDEFIDCLNCNPDVLSQFSNLFWFNFPIIGVLILILALVIRLVIGIVNSKENKQ
jgi:quinol-cytochrome oxidoreductase complex cytochrome b subunit